MRSVAISPTISLPGMYPSNRYIRHRRGDVRLLLGSHIISRQRDMLFACCACVASAKELPRTLLPPYSETVACAFICATPLSHVLGKPYSAVIVPSLTIGAAFPDPVAHGTYFHQDTLLLSTLSLRRYPRSCIRRFLLRESKNVSLQTKMADAATPTMATHHTRQSH
jgi:hypothetical protein